MKYGEEWQKPVVRPFRSNGGLIRSKNTDVFIVKV